EASIVSQCVTVWTRTRLRHNRLGTGHCALGTLLAVLAALAVPSAAAHPADRLQQHLMIRLALEEARVTIAIGGGLLANEQVLRGLDPNGDGTVTSAEADGWLADYLQDIHVFVDGQARRLDPAAATITVPDTEQFHLGLSPLVISFAAPVPLTEATAEHRLVVQVDYRIDLTDFGRDVETAAGVDLIDDGWPSKTTRIAFTADPALAGVEGEAVDAAAEWGGGLVGKANDLFQREKTPAFIATLIGLFVVMGALHAIQPGHGKTLVAAYLIATGGRPRDALTLAGVVTFTHTVSVFALAFATLAASEVFLPSRVVPVLSVVSGALVIGMGVLMLRNALRRRTATSHQLSAISYQHPAPNHDHEHLSEEEHARLHLAEVAAATVGRGEGRRVSMRSLVALGVSGGMAPCPDALAILLLAVGINQLGFGLLAIVAFSLGLAGVLVAFGLAIALAGPLWARVGRKSTGGAGRLNGFTGRLVAISPVVSACVVVLLGFGMLWRSGISA
ncbi:MAG: nickel/cobalt transporter, partial [Thermomicrobiales bacterium]